ncbi:MAG: DUF1501 domain-containing protein, partial [Planctomycetes bacterium]|nr:DUF1501 domain-containing protein [Planctomycetota bacterium]
MAKPRRQSAVKTDGEGRLLSRRGLLKTSAGAFGLSLPGFLQLRESCADSGESPFAGKGAKSCIVLYCWGGISHFESWDPKPHAPKEIRGLFRPIATATPGIQLSEHIPFLARQTEHLAIVRSIHHRSAAHGKGMYWNMTGHAPPQTEAAANLPPSRADWPSLASMVSQFRRPGRGVPSAMRLPYPLVDNGTLQAGEYGGWLGVAADPIVVRTPKGKAFGGVSRDLGSPVLNLAPGLNRNRLEARRSLLRKLEQRNHQPALHNPADSSERMQSFEHFRSLAMEMLLSSKVKNAFDLDQEPKKNRQAYGPHICGQSLLLARRLTEAGVPIVTVCCAAGDLNGSKGDHWDTHSNNFNRLKNTMLPAFDQPAAALIADLAASGRLEETLIVFLTDFGRTPKINGGAGRDHYPHAFSVVLAGGGIRGGQVYGSSDKLGAHPHHLPCGPNDLHATIFQSLGIPVDAFLSDNLGRPHQITDGKPLP